MAKVLKHTEAYNNDPLIEIFRKGIIDYYGYSSDDSQDIQAISFIHNFEEVKVGYFILCGPRLSSSEEQALKELGFNPDDINIMADIFIDNPLLTESGLDRRIFEGVKEFFGFDRVIVKVAYEYGKNLLPHQIKYIESLGYKHICGNKFLIGRNL